MVDLEITETDFHTKWYLTGMKNKLLKELSECIGDAETLIIARKLKVILKELKQLETR